MDPVMGCPYCYYNYLLTMVNLDKRIDMEPTRGMCCVRPVDKATSAGPSDILRLASWVGDGLME
ncbi:hypothetical protein GBA52_024262 [Prunus armeniaca]|nr:hypothetical protein GBA52_024262 [Prunus armeniaca]